ncbi:hypothetical protein ACJX0J_029961 [Zea mays]
MVSDLHGFMEEGLLTLDDVGTTSNITFHKLNSGLIISILLSWKNRNDIKLQIMNSTRAIDPSRNIEKTAGFIEENYERNPRSHLDNMRGRYFRDILDERMTREDITEIIMRPIWCENQFFVLKNEKKLFAYTQYHTSFAGAQKNAEDEGCTIALNNLRSEVLKKVKY